MLGKIKSIIEINGLGLENTSNLNGSNGSQLGFVGMLSSICGYSDYDGYKVETDKHVYYILIANYQSCCENWGYMNSEDDLNYFLNSELIEVNLVNTANEKIKASMNDRYVSECDIQFVDFVTNKGTFQLAIYNSHNGYYGHSIIVAQDDKVLLSDTL